MKRKHSDFTEVQLDVPRHQLTPDLVAAERMFTVRLPEGATITVPGGFDADEVFILLTVVREALR
jgi:hypothetical protein